MAYYTAVMTFCVAVVQTSGLYQYKIYGVLDDVLPDICADVYMDLEYRRQWDTYAKGGQCDAEL